MDSPDIFRHWKSSVWYRVLVLRWLYKLLVRYGVWYVRFKGTEEHLWQEAVRHAPPSYRWFGRSLRIDDVEQELRHCPAWQQMKERIQPGDKIWPFVINPWTMAMRVGYVVVRHGKPVAGVVTALS